MGIYVLKYKFCFPLFSYTFLLSLNPNFGVFWEQMGLDPSKFVIWKFLFISQTFTYVLK